MGNLLAVYATTGAFAAVIQIAYLAVAFVVGGLLYRRGRRSGEWTQWVLGLHLILSMGVGFLLTCAGMWARSMTSRSVPGLGDSAVCTRASGWSTRIAVDMSPITKSQTPRA